MSERGDVAMSRSGERTRPRCPLRRLAAMLLEKGKVRVGEGAIASTRGACAPQNESRFQRWDFAIVRIPGALPQVWNDSRALGAKRHSARG